MPVTMRDVAQEARVSIKTVSRVVNQQGEVSAETRQRVLAAIDRLGYRPSKVARALVTQRTDTIGLILADITNPFFAEVARGVLDTAEAHGYNAFLCNADSDPQQEIRALYSLADHEVDGTILFPSWGNQDKLRSFTDQHQPLVIVNRPFGDYPGMSFVLADIRRGAKLAVDYLVSRGHTEIGMLAGNAAPLDELQRARGFREALIAHDLPVIDDWIVAGMPILQQGRASTQQLLTEYPEITAIFAYNDMLAIGAMQACEVLGRRVPEECAVVGFDDIELAAMVNPSLTTVHMDKYELGRQAATRLLDMLDTADGDFPPIHMDVELVVRESA